jgi:hypothetical protein
MLSKAGTQLKPVMEMAGFSKVEIENLTLQQRIRRLIAKKRQDPGIPPPPTVIIVSSATSYASTLGTVAPSTADRSTRAHGRRSKRKDAPGSAAGLEMLQTLTQGMHSSSQHSEASSGALAELKEKGKCLQEDLGEKGPLGSC